MEPLRQHFVVRNDDFTVAGEASSSIKKTLIRLGIDPEIVRRIAIATYEGEINLVIHAGGGEIDLAITAEAITIVLSDHGPGIPDVEKAMTAGYSTATDQARELGFGAGMGMPNMKKYSDEMTVESTVGVGTTVTLVTYIK